MSSQRPFFLSTFFAAFRQQPTALGSASQAQPPNKHSSQATAGGPSSYSTSSTVARAVSSAAAAASGGASPSGGAQSPGAVGPSSPPSTQTRPTGGMYSQFPYHHTSRAAMPIPSAHQSARPRAGRRRGSDSSSEGFREVNGAEKLYIGGRTATGEEKFFKLGVVKRVRSGDRLSLDRLSL
ncbi:hypothetical protein QBC37DRAFT_162263 [Rhypophila decipiens]|uniref:Uncharacterized protein n=1 Tax=Rhypophila decipiens TaxID=261697 RepID=A0AAN6Y887_9PEZI|nr:hypothetical protein QBC37DRAFT_162263 [Rhypophila decipiens]